MDLSAYHANYTPIDLGNFSAPQPQQQKKKKNFFVDQISTAGGILGGIGGSFLSPIAGTAAGAGAGSALGQALENLITHDNVTKDVAKEGALGAVFGAGPIKLLKGGAALAAGRGIEGASQAALTPLRQKAGQALTNTADDLAIKNFRLTPSQLSNFQKKFGEDAGTVIRKYGFQTADDIAHKGIDPLQEQFNQAVTSIPGVAKQDLQKSLISRINKLTSAGPSDTQAMGKQLQQESKALLNKFGDTIDANELNAVRQQFDQLVNYTEKAANPARYGVNKRVADALRETLQKADPTGQLKGVGRELQKLRQLSENATRQEQLGRGSLPLNLPTLLGGATGAAAGGPVGAAGAALGTAAINSNAGRRLTMATAEKLGSGLSNSGSTGQSLKGIAGRVGTIGALQSAGDFSPQQPGTLEDALNQSLTTSATSPINAPNSTNPINANIGQGYQTGGDLSSGSPYSKEALLSDIQRDPQNADNYIAYYQKLDEIFGASAQPKLNSTASGVIADTITGLNSLNELSQKIGDSNVNNPIIGQIRGRNPFDTNAQNLQASIATAKQIVGKALEGGVLRKEDEAKYAKILPTLGDTDAVAQHKISELINLISQRLNQYQSNIGTGGANSLEDALLASQGAN